MVSGLQEQSRLLQCQFCAIWSLEPYFVLDNAARSMEAGWEMILPTPCLRFRIATRSNAGCNELWSVAQVGV